VEINWDKKRATVEGAEAPRRTQTILGIGAERRSSLHNDRFAMLWLLRVLRETSASSAFATRPIGWFQLNVILL
jgi:hypothetical protein